MRSTVIDIRQFLSLNQGERYYKGYFIPGHPGWLRVMVSKRRIDGLIEAHNFKVFLNDQGNVLWAKQVLQKVQTEVVFEQELEEFKNIIEKAGMLIFIEDFSEDD